METTSCTEEEPPNDGSTDGSSSAAPLQPSLELARGSDGQPWSPVKSTAVVKYSAVTSPVHYARLKFNTDLKPPPSNWLKSSAESYGLHNTLDPRSSGFSSFRLAHMFPDCVGEVDVVSDAENIKKLLKIPYSRGPVSMMVHRIENTLLIDEFDIHKHLLRQAESDWEWLRKFFYEHVLQTLSEKNKALQSYKNNTRYALQQKSLVSKFLHYSLAEPETRREGTNKFSLPIPLNPCGPALPEPGLEEGLPDCGRVHNFTRNVVWTFEDIQMLLGTDMPIFGGSTHPCISLRLRDVAKPISVLTGIDYWLDNLMSNVPEVVMCYHLDGIVQKYELVKTEDLPHLPDAKFSPKLIRDVAQNILSFLKSNATKAGHTYWLFKGRDDDVVKLYDLSSLCSDSLVDRGQNPFTVPVGMLLYRVARNMKHYYSPPQTADQGSSTSSGGAAEGPSPTAGTIRMLLKNALALLPKEKYPQIVTSAHYMVSDLYIPFGTDPMSPQLEDEHQPQESGEETGEEDDDNEDTASNSVPVTDLCISTRHSQFDYKYSQPPPLVGSLEERCKMALQHVSDGLECLQYFETAETTTGKDKQTHASQKMEEPQMAKPFQAIPMPYSKINPDDNSSSERPVNSGSSGKHKEGKNRQRKKSEGKSSKKESTESDIMQSDSGEDNSLKALLCMSQGGDNAGMLPTWHQPNQMDNPSWKKHLESLLLAKARLVYTTLAEQHYLNNRFGLSLRYLTCVINCCDGNTTGSTNKYGLVGLMLSRAGDCCLRIVQDWENVNTHRTDLACDDNLPTIDNRHSTFHPNVLSELPTELENAEQVLLASLRCYEKAVLFRPSDSLTRKLGNIHNEIGSMYMNRAASMFHESQDCIGSGEFQTLLSDSERHLGESLKAFELVNDCANVALIHSNRGRLMRLRAHCSPNTSSSSHNLTTQQRNYYNKAQNSYLAALDALKSRKFNEVIWDTVTWELSTSLFTIATLTQDYPSFNNKSQDEVEREVAELLLKALKYCDLETPGPRLPVYQFRAAKIHHRLASLYHKSYREHTSGDDGRRRNMLQLCQMHYNKASGLLFLLEHPSDLLTVQIERVSLAEFISEMATSNSTKLKSLQSALNFIVECKPILLIMEERNRVLPAKTSNPQLDSAMDEMELAEREEEEKLTTLLEQRLQFILRTIIKLILTGNSQKGSSATAGQNEKLISHYKQAYSALLKRPADQNLVTHLANVVDLIKQH